MFVPAPSPRDRKSWLTHWQGMDLATCAGLYSVISLETAHSTTTISSKTTALAASTTTDITTVLVIISDSSTIVQTEHVAVTTTSLAVGTVRSTFSANASYVEYNPKSTGTMAMRQSNIGHNLIILGSFAIVIFSLVWTLVMSLHRAARNWKM